MSEEPKTKRRKDKKTLGFIVSDKRFEKEAKALKANLLKRKKQIEARKTRTENEE